uniref:Uncharacterized protein n=1 Tax=Timema monikensis TaxID=170555 RepID=A0A7R9E1I5_9NEOP|nr:unnamed protein product [Timema monikensis]
MNNMKADRVPVVSYSVQEMYSLDLSRAWSHKRSIEQQLPTSSERLRTTNACLVNALSAVSSSIGKLSGLLLDSRSELCSLPSNEFPSEILKYSHPAVAGEDEIKGKEQADNDLMSQESFSKQLSGVTQRATKLEQEREHWRLEYQLLQLKYDKAKVALRVSHFLLMNYNGMKPRSGDLAVMIDFLKETANTSLSSGSNKLNEFENKLKAGNLERNNIQTALNSFDRPAPTSVTNMLGSLDCPLPPLQAEAEAREQEVKNYFTNRINELVVVSQETETKAAILAGEHRLELCQSGKQQSAEDLSEALEKLTRLQEELQTTTENYEVQLSIMSEHLANMNEKLTLQRDEIDQLKYQLTSKMVGLEETGEITETIWRGLVECKILLTSVDMGIIVGRGYVSVNEAEQHMMSARTLVHIWTREFLEALLCLTYLANNGPVATRSFYRDMTVEDFILRLLIQRCKYNY